MIYKHIKFSNTFHCKFNFVQIMTLQVWSRQEITPRPIFSVFQSSEAIG